MGQLRIVVGCALLGVAIAAHSTSGLAQTSTWNTGAPGVLRGWPQAGAWQTLLAKRPDGTLSCLMLSGKTENGQLQFVAGLRQVPGDLALLVSDIYPAKLTGDHVALLIDGVKVGDFPITRRVDDQGPLHTIGADVGSKDASRVLTLFRTGGEVRLITAQATYSFPLKGSAQSMANLRECLTEAQNLAPSSASATPPPAR